MHIHFWDNKSEPIITLAIRGLKVTVFLRSPSSWRRKSNTKIPLGKRRCKRKKRILSIRIQTANKPKILNGLKKSLKSSPPKNRSQPKSQTSACSQCRVSIITTLLRFFTIRVVGRSNRADKVVQATKVEEAFKENHSKKIPFKETEITDRKLLKINIVFILKRTRKYLLVACRMANPH